MGDLKPDQLGDALRALEEVAIESEDSDPKRAVCLRALAVQASKTMSPAHYVCGCSGDSAHWSLGVSHYTHFTSPIRRYADVLVHRELAKLCVGEAAADTDASARDAARSAVDNINACAQHAKWA